MAVYARAATDPQTDSAQLLDRLRTSYPGTVINLDGNAWEYITCGTGEHTVLLLPGALGVADTSFRQILTFAAHYRVISLGYPDAVNSLPALLDGIAGVLDAEGVTATAVIGGSYSGLVAQYFAIRYPAYVTALLLSNTSGPAAKEAVRMRTLASIAARLPERLLHRAMRATIPLFLRERSPEHNFWRTYFRAIIPRFSKPGLVNRLLVYAEMNLAPATQVWAGAPWGGPALIIAAENDGFAPPQQALALRQHCPHADYVVFPGQGHLAALDASILYLQTYQEFLCASHASTAG